MGNAKSYTARRKPCQQCHAHFAVVLVENIKTKKRLFFCKPCIIGLVGSATEISPDFDVWLNDLNETPDGN